VDSQKAGERLHFQKYSPKAEVDSAITSFVIRIKKAV
jgi:hypothetical protein